MSNRMVLKGEKASDIILKKERVEWIIIWLLLIFSFINVATLIASMAILLLFFRQREIGAIKILNVIALRTVINPGLAVDIEIVQNLKWGIIFFCSFYLIISHSKIDKNSRINFNKVLLPILVYILYSMVASFFTSTLPVVAIFKLISYVVVFIGIMIGVNLTWEMIDWLNWMNTMFMGLLIFSIPLIFNSIGYLINGHSFQGITDQPNMFGIILALYFAIILTRLQTKKVNNNLLSYIIIGIILYLGILSKSRTSLITMTALLIIYIIFLQMDLMKKILAYNIIGISAIVYLLIDKQVLNEIQVFLYKGQGNIFFSRATQIDGLVSNFIRNPLFGSGFAVPVTSFKSFSFSSEYIVEPGNLILSVLSYGGILGFVLFSIYIFKIFRTSGENFRKTVFLFSAPILISMGEMVFFSSNTIGIWLYMLLSIYMFDETSRNME